jgi:hypothetical protein
MNFRYVSNFMYKIVLLVILDKLTLCLKIDMTTKTLNGWALFWSASLFFFSYLSLSIKLLALGDLK